MNGNKFFPNLAALVAQLITYQISEERKQVLSDLIKYLKEATGESKTPKLNFICTHNSRRSQLCQVWAQTAADYFGVPLKSFSGGVEVTAFNHRAVDALIRMGFLVNEPEANDNNPVYEIQSGQEISVMKAFSKLYDHQDSPKSEFAAIMTCAHADENCPFIPGADARIPVRYDDPKAYDDTDLEIEKYDERSLQIAAEMIYVCRNVIGE